MRGSAAPENAAHVNSARIAWPSRIPIPIASQKTDSSTATLNRDRNPTYARAGIAFVLGSSSADSRAAASIMTQTLRPVKTSNTIGRMTSPPEIM